MFSAIYDFWERLPAWARLCFCLFLIGISVAVWFLFGRIWPYPGVVGALLFLFGGSKNRGGYHF